MPKRSTLRLTERVVERHKTLSNRTVAGLRVERDSVFWDRDLTGFGVRLYPSGGKVYIAQAHERKTSCPSA